MAQKLTEQEQRVLALHGELKRSIFKKIPALNGTSEIYLPQVYFKNLTDEEFVVMWTLPDLTIKVTDKCGLYIEARRKRLGLTRTDTSEVVHKKHHT